MAIARPCLLNNPAGCRFVDRDSQWVKVINSASLSHLTKYPRNFLVYIDDVFLLI